MKYLISVLFLSLLKITIGQEFKEAIKIEVDKDCKSSISNRTFKDEIFTKPVNIVNTLNSVVTLMFSYKENFIYDNKGPVLNFWFNQVFSSTYDTKHIYFLIDGVEYDLHQLIEFETYDKTIDGKTETWVGIGFYMNTELKKSFDNASEMEMAMIERKSRVRRTWKLNPVIIKNIVESYDCFVQYYTPIDVRLKEEKRIADIEYEKSLKSFDVNYRDSKWGDTKESVKQNQSGEIVAELEEAIGFKVKLNNNDFHAYYYFNKNRLYQGVYSLKEDYVNENNFYYKYKEIKRILTEKYGEPKKVTKQRDKSLYDGASEIGMAIQTGEYTEFTRWETKNSIITLGIEGENFNSLLTIRYKTKDFGLLLDSKEESKKKSMEGF